MLDLNLREVIELERGPGPHKVAVCAVMCQRIIGRRELRWSGGTLQNSGGSIIKRLLQGWFIMENPIKFMIWGYPLF